ncbi:hypothetical protein F5X68DRAFT_161001 [Plectosphaerella plurivora]|uniref:LRR-containing protein second PH domain-containing protein n=1 Tax=Plectosphaerella plurivora TaxID=936078 RepID=A0A9P8V1R5_9PEZI|nr:hypothetical protein F5X68DRAFT_161001 [Plectosphaerella plurivora]
MQPPPVPGQPFLPNLETTLPSREDELRNAVELRPSSSAPSLAATKKRNSFLAKTFRTFSSTSSLELASDEAPARPQTPPRKVLHKTPAHGSSIFHRINRRASKDSTTSSQLSDTSCKLSGMKVLKHGPLKCDSKLWKSRSEYLVLAEGCLVKFSNIEAAKSTFPDLASSQRLSRSSTVSSLTQETGSSSESRLEIPFTRILNIFKDEGSSPHFGIDVWWAEAAPAEIRRSLREFAIGKPGVSEGIVASNVETRIHTIVSREEPACEGSPLDIFPVIQRDTSSCYLLLGHNKCYLIRVAKTSVYKAPQDLDVQATIFGLTSLIRLKATMVPHEERFVLGYRLPCEQEKRLELASRWYREIVMTFMKADRAVKPAWPQQLQRDIFDIRGLTSQLHLPEGQDFGGLKRTLEAYCASYNCQPPKWTVSWKCERRDHNPEFRLLPSSSTAGYGKYQLLAVLKALRYNDYFRSLSFKDVDFSPLSGWYDLSQYSDSVADVSRNGLVLDTVHSDIVRTSPILFQELHALAFTSGSIRRIDLTNVLSSQRSRSAPTRFQQPSTATPPPQMEVARAILLLLRTQNIPLDSLTLSGNPLTSAEVDELASALCIPGILKELDISHCNLDERSLGEIWDALPQQGSTMEVLNTSRNMGNLDLVVIRNGLAHFTRLRKLNIAGNCLSQFTDFVFWDETIMSWQLEELDLSDIKLSEETVNVLATYLAMPESDYMRRVDLNNCGLTGSMAAVLFRSMGQGREIVCSISGNYLEVEGDDLTSAIACNYGPKALFADMVEYREEENYIKLIQALAVNNTIDLLSLVGTATPGQVSEDACAAVSEFFATNRSVQYLDYSGFSAKLDEGQLGLGFSQSLAGLSQNTTLRHLRIRNQKLNINIGDLASAIAANRTLQTLDVQENGFNLSNLTHMVRSLEKNVSIREFCPFSDAELNKTIRNSMQKVILHPSEPEHRRRRSSKSASKAADALAEDASKALVHELRSQWTVKMEESEKILERNRASSAATDTEGSYSAIAEYPSMSYAASLPALFGGLAMVHQGAGQTTPPSPVSHQATPGQEPITPPLEAVDRLETPGSAPHHVTRDEVMESPTAESPTSSPGLPTPPEWAADEAALKAISASSDMTGVSVETGKLQDDSEAAGKE